jgi:hypothetical protein
MRDRTANLQNANLALSQLSYSPYIYLCILPDFLEDSTAKLSDVHRSAFPVEL